MPAAQSRRIGRALKSVDRRARRATVGALVGLGAGGCLGPIFGALAIILIVLGSGTTPEYRAFVGVAELAAVLGVVPGAIAGLLIGPLILVRDARIRALFGASIGASVGAVLGAVLAWVVVGRGAPPPTFDAAYYTTIGLIVGATGGASVAMLLGWLRRRWPWMSRWDTSPRVSY